MTNQEVHTRGVWIVHHGVRWAMYANGKLVYYGGNTYDGLHKVIEGLGFSIMRTELPPSPAENKEFTCDESGRWVPPDSSIVLHHQLADFVVRKLKERLLELTKEADVVRGELDKYHTV